MLSLLITHWPLPIHSLACLITYGNGGGGGGGRQNGRQVGGERGDGRWEIGDGRDGSQPGVGVR